MDAKPARFIPRSGDRPRPGRPAGGKVTGMNASRWLAAIEPAPLIEFLGFGTARKERLFLTACCRRVARFSVGRTVTAFLDASEAFADGELDAAGLRTAQQRASGGPPANPEDEDFYVRLSAENAIRSLGPNLQSGVLEEVIETVVASRNGGRPALRPVFRDEPGAAQVRRQMEARYRELAAPERLAQVRLLRDVFGNPFWAIVFDPMWRTSDVVALARGIYDHRAFDRLPILHDALLDAGCTSDEILAHCRSEGHHVRGCWVVDLILGRE
jgi:hypothetical protein